MIIGSAMEALVTWTIVGLELAALAVIAGGFAWSAGKTFVVYIRDRTEQRYPSFRRELGRSTLIALELLVAADILRSLVAAMAVVMVTTHRQIRTRTNHGNKLLRSMASGRH